MRSFIIVPSYDISRVITLRRNGRSRVAARMANMRQISRVYTVWLGKPGRRKPVGCSRGWPIR